ncbi:tyrosyl-DNA phosphodiesterase [Aspergillus japonicus CBS 114.51]|uniref:Tyrosyl-DNA phosphodiesterase n=1 Tax=Aspergillus japonicus CBS 114.51 TaxID=1448312 RepID=A0A8T8WP28_ASPJA|nr:tyrosyl-DNA phosphodiesterase [Aspergillus japonicus CBS 114.51]RAH77551.1 tyrosyl-DNA phosphodiesterase [Aspergillus japonicus CBS 114.51]
MHSDDGDDADLRAAIAASLVGIRNSADEPPSRRRQQAVVDLTGETESESDNDVVPIYPKSRSVIGSETDDEADEDMKRAIALSLQESKGVQDPSASPPTPIGIFGLDRKQMEQERLARLAKRKAADTSSLNERESKSSKIEAAPTPRVSKPVQGSGNASVTIASAGALTSSPLQYPEGVVRKTWASGFPRQGDDIKIEEVLQKSDLELAVLSSFMWDLDWLFSKTDTRSTRFLLMMQAKDDATKIQYESEAAALRNVRLCFPPMDGQVNCMHSKLMLLFHPTYVRIAVPTANLTNYDWGEMNGVMENSVFLIDLPKRDEKKQECPTTAFYEDLVYFLKACTLHENIIAKLKSFDFAKTANYAFVHTIGGAHTGPAWERTGYCGLGRAVERMGLRTSKPLNIDFVTSSLGSLTDDFLRSIYLASQGDSGITDLSLRTSKTSPARHLTDPTTLVPHNTASEWKDDRFRVYFPSQATVAASKGGPNCAGTVCFQSRWYEGAKFPRHVLRDCESQRRGMLMHNKILYVRPDEPVPLAPQGKNQVCRAWAYVGSANLSESAWGRLVLDRTTKQPKLNCRNWECGVLVPVLEDPRTKSDAGGNSSSASTSSTSSSSASSAQAPPPTRNDEGTAGGGLMGLFAGTVPVPMRVPGRYYEGGRKPWFFSEG